MLGEGLVVEARVKGLDDIHLSSKDTSQRMDGTC
jgi:hypothetical protein